MCKKLLYLTIVLLVLGPALAQAATLGPVGWWKLDETAGAVAKDSAGANDGTLRPDGSDGAGAVGPKWVAGKFDGGLEFDGGAGNVATNDHVDLPIGPLLSTLSSTTVMTWANWSGTGGSWQRIFDFGSGQGTNMWMTPSRSGTNSGRFAIRTGGGPEQLMNMRAALPTGWHHVAVTIDSATMTMQMYVDGEVVRSGATTVLPKDMGVTTQNWLARSQYPDSYYKGALDEFRIYDRALSGDEVVNAMQGGPGYGLANTPSPANKAVNTLPDVILSWAAGQLAETHDVYFGTSLENVTAADSANPLDVRVSVGQAGTTYDVGRLAFSTTYYWRVDEIGPAPDFTPYRGNVWSFTVEPYAYTLGKASITASASSSQDNTMGPGKTVDGSGLTDDLHSTKATDMWLSSLTGEQPTWIQYAFDQVYALHEMLVWNYNETMESISGYGAKSVTVLYSVDGNDWTPLGDFEFAPATGEAPCAAGTKVSFAGVPAKFVKLKINSNWGEFFEQYGLSEVRFSYIPVKPTNLSPASGTVDLKPPVALSWRPGREVAKHEVYIGTDPDNLALAATVDEPQYLADVAEGFVYYWKVVEVNEAEDPPAWESPVLNFSAKVLPKNPGTASLTHLYTFEDGTANDSIGGANGALVGDAKVVDGSLVLDGNGDYMSMPGQTLALNTYSALSVVCTFTSVPNGNTGFHMIAAFGEEGTGAATWAGYKYLFITPARGDNVSRAAIQTRSMDDSPWDEETGVSAAIEHDDGVKHQFICTVDATTLTFYIDGEVVGSQPLAEGNNLAGISTAVAYLGKGVYPADPLWAGSVHEFCIYSKALSLAEARYLAAAVPKDPGTTSLAALYAFEDNVDDTSGNALNGTLTGCTFIEGQAGFGKALDFDGTDDYATLPVGELLSTLSDITVASWANFSNSGGAWQRIFDFGSGSGNAPYMFLCPRVNVSGPIRFAIRSATVGEQVADSAATLPSGWHHVAVTIDSATMSIRVYQDGVQVAGRVTTVLPKDMGVTTQNWLGKSQWPDALYKGSLDDFRIFNRALSQGEVRYLVGDR